MAVLSKTPLKVKKILFDKETQIPALLLTTKGPWGALSLGLLHPYPPIGGYGTQLRDQYLNTISHRISELKSPLLVCGDFNTTPWSQIFKNFLTNSSLSFIQSQRAPSTWPTLWTAPSIPIDHCLVKGLKIITYERGPDLGSDHWPLHIQIAH